MLIQFEFSNYRSFLEPACFSMEAAPIRAEDEGVDHDNSFDTGGMRMLKVAGIYGANAGGKSNLVRALDAMVHTVTDSAREGQIGDPLLAADPFRLSTESTDHPSSFEVVVADARNQYRYGFEVSATEISSEWLYRRPLSAAREHRLFERHRQDYERPHKDFGESRSVQKRTRPNALHLSVCAQLNIGIAIEVLGCFSSLRVAHGLAPDFLLPQTLRLMEEPSSAEAIRDLVRYLDVGIEGIDISHQPLTDLEKELIGRFLAPVSRHRESLPMDSIPQIEVRHSILDSQGRAKGSTRFRLDEESSGTQGLVALSGPLLEILRRGATLVLDELDAKLHPLVSRNLVRLFQNEQTNPRNAQLIFTAHDTSLLQQNLFRRDQIWFVEKNRRSASHLYSLAEFRTEDGKGVRNDARFEKNYLEGRFGAVPHLGSLHAAVAQHARSWTAAGGEVR